MSRLMYPFMNNVLLGTHVLLLGRANELTDKALRKDGKVGLNLLANGLEGADIKA